MRFTSTRDPGATASFPDAALSGYAPGGGAWQPEDTVDFRQFFLLMDGATGYAELAATLASSFAGEDFGPLELAFLLSGALAFEPVLRPLGGDIHALELFHGPTGSYRDYGAAFLARYLEALARKRGRRVRLLAASRGDSGCAIARAFAGRPGLEVVILYPEGTRIRGIEAGSLAAGNVFPLAVRGDFAACQGSIRACLGDEALAGRLGLCAASSANVARLVPQAFYFAWAFSRLKASPGGILYALPPGNAGNLIAGIYAWKWGLPMAGFVTASSGRDLVLRCLEGCCGLACEEGLPEACLEEERGYGDYENGERLEALMVGAPAVMRTMVRPRVVTEAEAREAARATWRDSGYALAPDAAAALVAARDRGAGIIAEGGRAVVLCPSHPAKHAAAFIEAGIEAPPLPARLAFLERPLDEVEGLDGIDGIDAGPAALAAWLEARAGGR